MKLTLTFVKRTPKTSQRTGKPFTSLSIKTQEYGDRYLSGFDGKETASWKEGDTVEATVEENGEYLNFSVPKAPRGNYSSTAPSGADTEKILDALRKVFTAVQTADTSAKMALGRTNLLMKRLEVKGVLDVLEKRTSDGSPLPFSDPKEEAQKEVDELAKEFSDDDFPKF